MRYFEDFQVGETIEPGSKEMQEEEMLNQRDELVMSMEGTHFIGRRRIPTGDQAAHKGAS